MEKYNNYLYHYGILGMRWGVQNGPPYPIDKTVKYSMKKKAKKEKNYSDDYKSAHDGKKAYELSDVELARRNNRFAQESKYRKSTLTEKDVLVKAALVSAGTALVTSFVKGYGNILVKKALDKLK